MPPRTRTPKAVAPALVPVERVESRNDMPAGAVEFRWDATGAAPGQNIDGDNNRFTVNGVGLRIRHIFTGDDGNRSLLLRYDGDNAALPENPNTTVHTIEMGSKREPLEIIFISPVRGAGTSIRAGTVGDFTVVVRAYDAARNLLLLATKRRAGNAAVFLGVTCLDPIIDKIEIDLLRSDMRGLRINQLSVMA